MASEWLLAHHRNGKMTETGAMFFAWLINSRIVKKLETFSILLSVNKQGSGTGYKNIAVCHEDPALAS